VKKGENKKMAGGKKVFENFVLLAGGLAH